jgi:hypothetical protein
MTDQIVVFKSFENKEEWYRITPTPNLIINERYKVVNTHYEGPSFLWGDRPDRFCVLDEAGEKVWVGSCQVEWLEENRNYKLEHILG